MLVVLCILPTYFHVLPLSNRGVDGLARTGTQACKGRTGTNNGRTDFQPIVSSEKLVRDTCYWIVCDVQQTRNRAQTSMSTEDSGPCMQAVPSA